MSDSVVGGDQQQSLQTEMKERKRAELSACFLRLSLKKRAMRQRLTKPASSSRTPPRHKWGK